MIIYLISIFHSSRKHIIEQINFFKIHIYIFFVCLKYGKQKSEKSSNKSFSVYLLSDHRQEGKKTNRTRNTKHKTNYSNKPNVGTSFDTFC